MQRYLNGRLKTVGALVLSCFMFYFLQIRTFLPVHPCIHCFVFRLVFTEFIFTLVFTQTLIHVLIHCIQAFLLPHYSGGPPACADGPWHLCPPSRFPNSMCAAAPRRSESSGACPQPRLRNARPYPCSSAPTLERPRPRPRRASGSRRATRTRQPSSPRARKTMEVRARGPTRGWEALLATCQLAAPAHRPAAALHSPPSPLSTSVCRRMHSWRHLLRWHGIYPLGAYL